MSKPASIRSKVQGLLLAFTITIFALSSHVNVFQGFFYAADRFPFVMSLVTIAILLGVMASGRNSKLSRPALELPLLGLLLVAWLGSNAFSTSRWRFITVDDCNSMPVEKNPEFFKQAKTWCYEIQALRALIWMEWVIFLISFGSLLFFALKHSSSGATHVWTTSIGQFNSSRNARTTVFQGSAMDPDFDLASYMEQQHHAELTAEQAANPNRYSWPQKEGGNQFEAVHPYAHRQDAQRQEVQPHYQTRPPHDWERFDGSERDLGEKNGY